MSLGIKRVVTKSMKDKSNEKKFTIFLEVAKELNNAFDVTPVLYGSLGLYRIINESKSANDIDFLVPEKLINEKWSELIALMKSLKFELKNEHEHEFSRDGEIVAFGSESDLIEFAKVDSNNLKVSQIDGIGFRELTPEQYLSCYQLMLRDNYRQEKRGSDDKEKITLIEEYLEKE